MAKEKHHRSKAKERLIEKGYTLWIPKSQRYGAGITYWDGDRKNADDVFNVFDLLAWKEGEMLFVQYTGKGHIRRREKKIHEFMAEHNLERPDNVRFEVWGYEDGEGYTKIIKI